MRKFTIIGVILTIIAVGVFLACAQAPTKPNIPSRQMVIKVNTETGEVVTVENERQEPPEDLNPAELQEIYRTKNPRHIGTILYYHQSPGCVTIIVGGVASRICR